MRKIFSLFLTAICLLGLVCNVEAKDYPLLEIGDIDWKVENGFVWETYGLVFTYTNNSDYTITDVEMKFTQREDVTDEDLSCFDELRAEHDWWSDDELKEIYILGYNRKFADPGETVSDSPCVIDGTHVLATKIEQYELMEPSEVSVAYIYNDRMYVMYYDFNTDTYNFPYSDGVDLKEWSDSEISALIPEPDFQVVSVSSDKEDRFYFYVFGVTVEDFNTYVDACKNSGFTDVRFESEGERYRAGNFNGYELTVSYDAIEETMSTCIELDD